MQEQPAAPWDVAPGGNSGPWLHLSTQVCGECGQSLLQIGGMDFAGV